MIAYYNEIDPKAAAWLRELIKQGHIAPGEVDERSIVDVRPDDLRSFTQCHFFAGIGVWSYALRRAGWEDNRPVWTGSCPCQPFSAAGKGNGFADERHLWPSFFHLIENVQPRTVFGEQVASKDGLGWLDLVQTDLEGKGYTFGAIDTCAAGFGAPHIRQRLYWVANAEEYGYQGEPLRSDREPAQRVEKVSSTRDLADTISSGLQGHGRPIEEPVSEGRQGAERHRSESCGISGLGIPDRARSQQGRQGSETARHGSTVKPTGGANRMANSECEQRDTLSVQGRSEALQSNGAGSTDEFTGDRGANGASPTNGFWRDADWLFCRDGKWRPVEPGTFPLAHGASARV